MAQAYTSTGEIILFDLSPGPVHWGHIPPQSTDGTPFTSNSHSNVSATGVYLPGYKVGYLDKTNNGPSILAYMKYSAGTIACAAGHICSYDTSSTVSSTWYTITNDGDDGILSPVAYVALEAMTDTYWGWFWCGGVAPADYVSAFSATDALIDTNGSVADESLLEMVDGDSDEDIIFAKAAATNFQAFGLSFAIDA